MCTWSKYIQSPSKHIQSFVSIAVQQKWGKITCSTWSILNSLKNVGSFTIFDRMFFFLNREVWISMATPWSINQMRQNTLLFKWTLDIFLFGYEKYPNYTYLYICICISFPSKYEILWICCYILFWFRKKKSHK